MSSTTAKQRRVAQLSEGNWLQQQREKEQQQQRQRQVTVHQYTETFRSQTKRTKKGVFIKLLILPLAITVFSMVSVSLKILHNEQLKTSSGNGPNIPPLETLSSDKSKSLPQIQKTAGSPSANRPEKSSVVTAKQKNPSQPSEPLPKWITDYAEWHQAMRAKFPGDTLFTHPEAPKLLVRTCLGICGGLHDRLGQLPWDLYLAMRLKRVLLMAWQRPRELENFLLPPSNETMPWAIDWRIPESQQFGFIDIKRVRSEVRELFNGTLTGAPESHPGEGDFWEVGFETALVRAGAPLSPVAKQTLEAEKDLADIKILRHRLLGHLDEEKLEKRLEIEGYYRGETHHKPSDLHRAPTFGAVWKMFFRPSPEVRTEIVQALGEMNLLRRGGGVGFQLGDPDAPLPPTVTYTAVHCRVRHPKAHPVGQVVKGKNDRYPADKTGLPWIEGGPQREFALETANKALTCARDVHTNPDDPNHTPPPVYFLSDSNDLVTHVAIELSDPSYLKAHGKNASWVQPGLLQTVQAQHIVARNTTLENAHIDRQKGREAPAYYATFVDLYLAMTARCVVYGIGYYAAFAAKVSGTDCAFLYAKETWGNQVEKSAHICPNHRK